MAARSAKVLAPLTISAEVAVVCTLVVEPAARLGLVLAAVLMVCFRWHCSGGWSSISLGARPYELAGIAVIVPAVAACVRLTERLDDLVDLLR
ncbi:hypothetical protein OG874_42815 [Nocardia sp. NBC_00565]|uniref:hypothetical protein n=1 Tax=Nocardia sp. NBC_00565 TaxID=2975993 RepID=UPI002E82379F|nr:hypothetical protein [Nocardia sp. NBC_00565]WUC03321.1 hypothetical protein OG874_42815 [Nocardia sp. NBC_00565]